MMCCIVLLFAGERLVRTEEFDSYADMAEFVLKHGELYRCEVIII
jgi:hypothetical protein